MSRVSIVVPVYNVERYLSQCIESLLSQTIKDFEILLIDDGSQDNSGLICDEYAKKDSRVRVCHKRNGGVSAARNTGIDMATGQYIMFCDSDDYADVKWCEELLKHIEENPNSWCFCGCNVVDANGEMLQHNCVFQESTYMTMPISNYWDTYKTNYSALLWIRIFETSIIKEHGLRFDEKMSLSEDVLFNLEYGAYCDKFAVVNLPLYNHRMYLNNEIEHLDGKIPKEMFYTNKRIYTAKRLFITEENSKEFETDMFYRFIGDMKAIARDTNISNKVKLKKLKEILYSREFGSAMKFADTRKESKKFLILLKFKMAKFLLRIMRVN